VYLIEIFLPTADNSGERFPKDAFDAIRRELTERFGGVTAFTRVPAVGLWQSDEGEVHRDEIAIVEVMAETIDRAWWRDYRRRLEREFRQEEVVVRAYQLERL
jgi:hypothetical protein